MFDSFAKTMIGRRINQAESIIVTSTAGQNVGLYEN